MEQTPRRSERSNKGQPPVRYGDYDMRASSTLVDGSAGFNSDLDITAIPANRSMNPFDKTMTPDQGHRASEDKAEVSLADVMKGISQIDQKVTTSMNTMEERMNVQMVSFRQEIYTKMAQFSAKVQDELKTSRYEHTGAIPKRTMPECENVDQHDALKSRSKQDILPLKQPPIPMRGENHARQGQPTFERKKGTPEVPPLQQSHHEQYDEAFRRMLITPKKLYDLPLFDGKPEEWPMFDNAFQHSTSACGYNNFENMTRLQKALKGKAFELVEALLIHPDNVPVIIDRLKFHFGDPQRLVRSQMNKVRNIAAMSETDLSRLIDYSAMISNLVAFMRSAKAERHLDNPQMLEDIVFKLPLRYQYDWAQFVRSQDIEADMTHFDDWLYGVAASVKIIENMQPVRTAPIRRNTDKKFVGKVEDDVRSIVCGFCQAAHKLESCENYKTTTLAERWNWVKENRACFSCLSKGHQAAYCRRSSVCEIDGCRRRHHRLLHAPREQEVTQESPILSLTKTTDQVFFKIVPIVVYGLNGAEIRTFAQLDEGSSLTLIDKQLADELNLDGVDETMTIQWVNHLTSRQKTSVMTLSIRGQFKGAKKIRVSKVRTISNLTLPSQSLSRRYLIERYPQLKHVPMSEYEHARPRILIGLDNTHLMKPLQFVDCDPDGICAVRTQLGWVVYGERGNEEVSVHEYSHVGSLNYSLDNEGDGRQAMNEMICHYYDIEGVGTKPTGGVIQSEETKRALKILDETTKYHDDHYETGLLWAKDEPHMPDSYGMALRRFHSLEKKFDRDEEFREMYMNNLNGFFEKGYARMLSPDEYHADDGREWYLPHFAVLNPNKPGKLRVVMDAAATVDRLSFNSHMIKGPDLTQPLLDILFQFRQYPIAICADIKEMFLRVKIRQADRSAQRFIWRDDVGNLRICEMQSMIFGASCSPTTAQYIKNYHAEKYRDQYPRAVEAVQNNHYVDDYVMSFMSEEEAMDVSMQVKDVLSTAGFELRNFLSNSEAAANHLNGHATFISALQFGGAKTPQRAEKILGMYWHNDTDEFVFRFKFHNVPDAIINQTRIPTRRELLSMMMSIFDPYGFLANYLITAKIIVQETWALDVDWDEPITVDLARRWFQWQSQLNNVELLRIPRCYKTMASREFELHTFVDASESAYAAVCYFRVKTDKETFVSFVCAKTRVAPKKMLTVPRLELQAAVLGVRLARSAEASHTIKPSSRIFWTDSKTVLKWIRSESREYKPFVAHRITEIMEATTESEWRWIPTKMNVADDATRSNVVEVSSESRWLCGPEILFMDEIQWPLLPEDLVNHDDLMERRKTARIGVVQSESSNLIDFYRFSNFNRLVRTCAYVHRFLQNVRAKRLGTPRLIGELSYEEMVAGEVLICKQTQQEAFPVELGDLGEGEMVDKRSAMYKLSPYLHCDGLIRIQGRIDAATVIPLSTKRPIIMPKDHEVSRLIIRYHHQSCFHVNDEVVIGRIRQKYWIPSVRQQLLKIKRSCMRCRLNRAKPSQPLMGDLPRDRVSFTEPFENVGVDYFGPVYVVVGRSRVKRWVALFTCLNIRAIHLEVAHDLSTDAFIMCLRNFISLRGRPRLMRSDNGTNFVGLKNELLNIPDFFDMDRVTNNLAIQGIEWKFNTPTDASAGGVWERMVRTVKTSMNAVFQDRATREDVLRNVLCEIANIVNSIPLTHVPVTPDDEEPLTPNHFILHKMNSNHMPGPVSEKLLCSRKQWIRAKQMQNHFYKRWIDEYLPILTRRPKWFEKVPPLSVGELVLVCDSDLPRSRWQRGRIERISAAADGQVRAAWVKTSTGTLKRPANKLAVLSMDYGESSSKIHGGKDEGQPYLDDENVNPEQ